MDLKEKLNKYFANMSLYKKSASTLFLNLSLPNFIRDYFIRKYSNQDGTYDIDLISEKVNQLIPNKTTWPLILDNIIIPVKKPIKKEEIKDKDPVIDKLKDLFGDKLEIKE